MWKILFVIAVIGLFWLFSKDPATVIANQPGVVRTIPAEAPSIIDELAVWLREHTPKK